MATQTELEGHLPSTRQSRMKIDSLLNPNTDDGEYSISSYDQKYLRHFLGYSPGFTSSPGYPWYSRYPGYHDTSPGAVSTAGSGSNRSSPILQHLHRHMFLSYRPSKSAHSSLDSYQPREQYDSVSNCSSTYDTNRRRPPRPKYKEEEMYFIWYHRVDLCQEWKEVRESFNRQFPSRQRRGFQGIQCKFYRFIKEKKCPTLREGEFLREGAGLSSADSNALRFGVAEWSNVWYPWMCKSLLNL